MSPSIDIAATRVCYPQWHGKLRQARVMQSDNIAHKAAMCSSTAQRCSHDLRRHKY